MGMTIYLNGKKSEIERSMSVSQLLEGRKVRPEIVTVEVNNAIVEKAKYSNTMLKPEDKVEFVYYMGGGEGSQACVTRNSKMANNILELIGNTPMVKLNKIVTKDMASIFAKLESFNPGGSVKDRICLSMIEDAESKGLIKPGATIIEPTSGNTGIGLAIVSVIKGYKCILTMPETMSLERIYILRSYGAEVVLTPGVEGMLGSIKKAEELAKKISNSFIPHQFENLANPDIHRKTTAQEILTSMDGKVDAFVAGIGTGGTITGVGEVLKKHNPKVRIVAVEPTGSPVLSGGKPGPHKIQGIGAGFIPDVLNKGVIDEIIKVDDNDAFKTSQRLAKEEGLFMGISSGAAAWTALKVAKSLKKGNVAVILPDTGERYFSMEQYFEA